VNRPSLFVLDVGHGNAAVLADTGGIVVIDTGKGGVLIDFLRKEGIKAVDVLLISHADTDHVKNAQDVLLDKEIKVGLVCYNSDASKQSSVWRAFRKAIKEARRKKQSAAEPQLTITQTGKLDRGVTRVEVLYPFPEAAGSGPGGEDEEGNPLTSNSMSAVVRLTTAAGPMVLLAGDVETGCLDAWQQEGIDPATPVLVFPHHGGNPGTDDPVAFAESLTKAVRPKVVIFSIHRSQYELPRPEVVEAVRRAAPGVRIACTQLSTHCAPANPTVARTHLNNYVASGKHHNACCAGTIVIDISGREPVFSPSVDQHLAFIRTLPATPLCIK
jgi:beta-lactamase superfamily II metal-dependent hydrolase